MEVFTEALRRLAQLQQLPAAEEPINLELFWLALKAHHDLLNSPQGSMPFSILAETTNQPEPDDSARSARMKKRPDFSCIIKNPQAADFRKSQVFYYLECKRLGNAIPNWVFNENYAEHGVTRFVHLNWQYAKGCESATMIGYLQNMAPNTVLTEVNAAAAPRGLPSLQRAAANWAAQGVTPLSQPALTRTFVATQFQLGHLWVDLRHCQFKILSNAPPQTPAAPAAPLKAAPKKKATAKAPKKAATKAAGVPKAAAKPKSAPKKRRRRSLFA